jgi:hypothetical protein
MPQMLILDDGDQCQIRDGGAWSYLSGHPTWYGFYGCADGRLIYGPGSGLGIDETAHTWTVFTTSLTNMQDGPVHKHAVRTAYFVGTA